MPGYDPVIQAMAGYVELTGDPNGTPVLCGVPVIDLKAGDEVYANVLLALAERAETGQGKEIHVSMLQAAASWLITTLPLIDFGCEPWEITRAGNEHRKFVPTNVYPARDGFFYMAIGSDAQWRRLTGVAALRLARHRGAPATNEGRISDRRKPASRHRGADRDSERGGADARSCAPRPSRTRASTASPPCASWRRCATG